MKNIRKPFIVYFLLTLFILLFLTGCDSEKDRETIYMNELSSNVYDEEYDEKEIEFVESNEDIEKEPIKISYEELYGDENIEYLYNNEIYTPIKKITTFSTYYAEKNEWKIIDPEDNNKDEKILVYRCFAEDYSGNKWYVELPEYDYYSYSNVYLYGWLDYETVNGEEYPAIDVDYIVANIDYINKQEYKENVSNKLNKITQKYKELVFEDGNFIENDFVTLNYKFNFGEIELSFDENNIIKSILINFNKKIEEYDIERISYIISCISEKNFSVSLYIDEAIKLRDTFDKYGNYAGYTNNNITCKIYEQMIDKIEKPDTLYFYFAK